MNVFGVRDGLISDYERFTRSFIRIKAADIRPHVDAEYGAGRFWPAPLVQLNPSFVPGGDLGKFIAEGQIHPECAEIHFCKTDGAPGSPLVLHKHQEEAIRIAKKYESYVGLRRTQEVALLGLTRDELRYILDPADVYGPDFPSETFRVLKGKGDQTIRRRPNRAPRPPGLAPLHG